jgi:hypothetical protein
MTAAASLIQSAADPNIPIINDKESTDARHLRSEKEDVHRTRKTQTTALGFEQA